ncbi:MAG TPA: hypothetical protein ENJ55_00015, partial [Rhizobiales bacterium]|nr:hypothetical protein [Hyphomicrobiales bacterium]
MEAVRKFIIGDNNFSSSTPWGGWAAFLMTVSFYLFQILTTVVIGVGLVIGLHGVNVFAGEYSPTDIPSFINIGI